MNHLVVVTLWIVVGATAVCATSMTGSGTPEVADAPGAITVPDIPPTSKPIPADINENEQVTGLSETAEPIALQIITEPSESEEDEAHGLDEEAADETDPEDELVMEEELILAAIDTQNGTNAATQALLNNLEAHSQENSLEAPDMAGIPILYTAGSVAEAKLDPDFAGFDVKHVREKRSDEGISLLGWRFDSMKDILGLGGGSDEESASLEHRASLIKRAAYYKKKSAKRSQPAAYPPIPAPDLTKCKGLNAPGKATSCDTVSKKNYCALEVEDVGKCRSLSADCSLNPICLSTKEACNKCAAHQLCAFKKPECTYGNKKCSRKQVCLTYAVGGAVEQEEKKVVKKVKTAKKVDKMETKKESKKVTEKKVVQEVTEAETTEYKESVKETKKVVKEYSKLCKISSSSKSITCKATEVCSAVLPYGKTCKPRGKGDCPLEPRCLTLRESKKCDNAADCRLRRLACLLVEECDPKDPYRCAIWPRCSDLGMYGENFDDSKRVDPYLKWCKVKGSYKKALCLKEEKCVPVVSPEDPCVRGATCKCTKFEPGCLAKAAQTCDTMKCKRKCEYFSTSGCNQFILGPCCPGKRKPYLLNCPAKPFCLIDYIIVKAKSPVTKRPRPSSVCDLDAESGYPCSTPSGSKYPSGKYQEKSKAVVRYHFSNYNQCEPFVYEGCGGNGNNFKTEAECQAACLT